MRKGTMIVAAAVAFQLVAAAPPVATLLPGQVALAGCDEGPKDCNPPDPAPVLTEQSAPSGDGNAPSVEIRLTDDSPRRGEEFTIRLVASDADGIDIAYWWATAIDDDALLDTHVQDCQGATPCRKGWKVSTGAAGNFVLHAQARDRSGALSDEVTRDVRVRHSD